LRNINKKLLRAFKKTREGQIYKVWLMALEMSEEVIDPNTFEWIEPIATKKVDLMLACENELEKLGYKPTIRGLFKKENEENDEK